MKRSHSLALTEKTPKLKRSLTWEENSAKITSNSIACRQFNVPATTKSTRPGNNFLVSPVSLASFGRKPSSKILTSDFWTDRMKLKLRKKVEGIGAALIAEKLRAQDFMKFEEFRITQRKNFGTNLEKMTNVQKVGFIDEIILKCKNETADSQKLRHEFFHSRAKLSARYF